MASSGSNTSIRATAGLYAKDERSFRASLREVRHIVQPVGGELRGGIEHRPPLRVCCERLDLLAELLVQGGDPGRPSGVGRFSLHRAEVGALALARVTAARAAGQRRWLSCWCWSPGPSRNWSRSR